MNVYRRGNNVDDTKNQGPLMPRILLILLAVSLSLIGFAMIVLFLISAFHLEMSVKFQVLIVAVGICLPMLYMGFVLIIYAVDTRIFKYILIPIWIIVSLGCVSLFADILLGNIAIE